MPVRQSNRHDGMVLMIVLVFALLLVGSVATLSRQAVIDSAIARNRENRERADGLARGGIELAKALILADKIRGTEEQALETRNDVWATIREHEIEAPGGGTLRLRIEDATSLLNLNAVVVDSQGDDLVESDGQEFLEALFEKVIDEMPIPPGEKVYDVSELTTHLIDFVDADNDSLDGGDESRAYQYRSRDEPGPLNRPLLSIDELRAVPGFDAKLVDALKPYLTVHPPGFRGGINPNTAPPHVLALIFFEDGVQLRLADEDDVREILKVREEGGFVCGEDQSLEACTPMSEIVPNAAGIFPPLSFVSDVFIVVSEAQVGDMRRSVEAVLDRSEAPSVTLLSWRVL